MHLKNNAINQIVNINLLNSILYHGKQASQAWDDELQNVVQMSFAQGRQTPLTSPILQGLKLPQISTSL